MNSRDVEQHALRIRNLLEAFHGRALADWAIGAIAQYSIDLHAAVPGLCAPPRMPRIQRATDAAVFDLYLASQIERDK